MDATLNCPRDEEVAAFKIILINCPFFLIIKSSYVAVYYSPVAIKIPSNYARLSLGKFYFHKKRDIVDFFFKLQLCSTRLLFFVKNCTYGLFCDKKGVSLPMVETMIITIIAAIKNKNVVCEITSRFATLVKQTSRARFMRARTRFHTPMSIPLFSAFFFCTKTLTCLFSPTFNM